MLFPFKQTLMIFLTAALLLGCASPVPPTADSTPSPVPDKGSAGMGDPYYPNLGNGGYDVQNYTIALSIDPPANQINGSTTLTANAMEYLGSFNLDFHELTVDSVSVNDEAAEYSRDGDELTISPATPLDADKPFTVVIEYHGSPELIRTEAGLFEMGWSHTESGVINVWGEPDAASSWFPANNHPRDKATFQFEISVPDPWIVAASGTLQETREDGDQTTFIWQMDVPMATYLASISIDQYDLFTQRGPDGITIRSYFPQDFPSQRRILFNFLPSAIAFFSDLFGPYPFKEYGVVIAPKDGFCALSETALEVQSMSLHCPSEFMTSETVIVHEFAHQWFGDSVSLENWKDIWLKEGFATYSEWLWESRNDPDELNRLAEVQLDNYFDNPRVSVAEPEKDELYTNESYTGGALVFHALRTHVGDEAFFEIMQTYVERYRYGNAGSDEFIAVAEEVSEQDLTSFFDAWLFSEDMPDTFE